MRCLDSITDATDMNLSKLRKIVKDREAWRAAVHGVTKTRTRVSNRITTSSQAWTVKREMEERDFEIGHFCAPRKWPPRSSWAGGWEEALVCCLIRWWWGEGVLPASTPSGHQEPREQAAVCCRILSQRPGRNGWSTQGGINCKKWN